MGRSIKEAGQSRIVMELVDGSGLAHSPLLVSETLVFIYL
ncbi:hypothetical protein ALFP_3710 [Alcaligenes faecalis]|nr:hypothetical protein ALFP_3710 [Alcaligenes faecalis]